MIRVTIRLDVDDMRWLSETARRENVSMAEMMRRAVRRIREAEENPSFRALIERTAGSWPNDDGLEYQRKIREEWDREWN